MIPPEKRSASVYERGDLLAVVAVDRNAAGHGIDRPEPDVLSRKTATPEDLGRSVIAALISNHANAPLQPWLNPDLPTVWKALGFKSETAFVRGTVLAMVSQRDYDTAEAIATSRRGSTFLALKPRFLADLNRPEAVGNAVLAASRSRPDGSDTIPRRGSGFGPPIVSSSPGFVRPHGHPARSPGDRCRRTVPRRPATRRCPE